ncbi:FAD-dependent monooxygenase [Chitinophaga pendula]|uniref:FAD-dependent monooxygenase n=1 Tax=Chitinophaga TaxID=79328 RepID=UPI000BAE9AC1|nr:MULTISPECIES: FAD-dependent monooxygenase [Chitinophaga]ASZ09812.1 monooxygenase [Chitinophaga sp. MD30]UCJ07248.1 FAD-dependent monooxygenase [Chitinophaga pendula]
MIKGGIIIGGGIGGLTTAIALTRRGIPVTLYEQAPALLGIGSGLNIASNALVLLAELGLADAIAEAGHDVADAVITDHRERVLTSIPVSYIKQRTGHGIISIHRGKLLEVLLSQVEDGIICTSKRFQSYVQDEEGVTVYFEDGSSERGGFLICADGVHSRGRQQLHPEVRPRYSGQVCWRFIVPGASSFIRPADLCEMWGQEKGLRAAYVPVNREELYCYITHYEPAGGKDDPATVKDYLSGICQSFPDAFHRLIAAVHPAHIIRSDCYDLAPIGQWYDGRAVLLGDAAHATTPNLGQGACQAVEDAYVLAQCLEEEKSPQAAFVRFQQLRKDRTTYICNTSWSINQIVNKGGWQKSLAKGLLSLLPGFMQRKQIGQVYFHDIGGGRKL